MAYKLSFNTVAVRIAILAVLLFMFAITLQQQAYASIALTLILVGAAIYELYRHLQKQHQETRNFLQAIKNGEVTQHVIAEQQQKASHELVTLYSEVSDGLQKDRRMQEEEIRRIKALIAHIPIPLISISDQTEVVLHNSAARKLFSGHVIRRLEDFEALGEVFYSELVQLQPGNSVMMHLNNGGVERQLKVAMSQITMTEYQETIISLLDIQSELDSVQLNAWQELISVLTHEMLNSITPISSLAQSMTNLLDKLEHKILQRQEIALIEKDLTMLKKAVATISRRSVGLTQFVQNYRSVTHIKKAEKQVIDLAPIIDRMIQLLEADFGEIATKITLSPNDLTIYADPQLLEQLLLNLLKNALQATKENDANEVQVNAFINSDGRAVIEIADRGKGIPVELHEKVFLPFYTTKDEGTGVGLALARQIMLAHGGQITLSKRYHEGAKFVLLF